MLSGEYQMTTTTIGRVPLHEPGKLLDPYIKRQFKNEVHQCLMIIHRIPQKGFDSQDIFEDDD